MTVRGRKAAVSGVKSTVETTAAESSAVLPLPPSDTVEQQPSTSVASLLLERDLQECSVGKESLELGANEECVATVSTFDASKCQHSKILLGKCCLYCVLVYLTNKICLVTLLFHIDHSFPVSLE